MKILRKMLLPFALLYGFVTWSRNLFYNSGILKSKSYNVPVICVGNLNTGGTGKSPMIEYLLKLLLPDFKVATLSRGYKRTSKGYKLLNGNETAAEVGDEPLQFKRKFKNALIAVDVDRQNGTVKLQQESAEIILLDDAFQHRKVKAGLNILLTAYGDLYVNDFMLPTGNLREPTLGAERAKIVVVTKCPPNLTKAEMELAKGKLKLQNYQQLYFSFIEYDEEIFSEATTAKLSSLKDKKFTLITGIANPKPLINYLEGNGLDFEHLAFKDHHNFTTTEITRLQKETLLLTTEKDYVRLRENFKDGQLFYLPVKTAFLNNEEAFKQKILSFVHKK
ncbi:tetraacyldisaccharide 4'-kinase [Salegentibacter salinarum]|uniref:Tetraacyldisaccharide 4'-kinase n=1 Tax=Salegentibacter salinarum TaxID=447422 RepID=A0A2N0TU32_9FLAO|nr:tetraacyldisaccharide 4'-kinase [Salegentibacter salinarum]PKD18241.1 tetraacyldisaccharide 4'-kinase [Salegentibacter salinarum]SKB43266.1 lipid-A-disaccharide kinase [Salegentibacter salinarum]